MPSRLSCCAALRHLDVSNNNLEAASALSPVATSCVMLQLLRCGCSVNAADYDGRRALHLAASVGNAQILDVLLKHGADADAKDRWGNRALEDATRESHGHCEKVLRAAST